ncbi:MAG: hypothetical protein ACPGXK_11045, partial [Phycisphaerae bacterium]
MKTRWQPITTHVSNATSQSVCRIVALVAALASPNIAEATRGACCDPREEICYDDVSWLACTLAGFQFGGHGTDCSQDNMRCDCASPDSCSDCQQIRGPGFRRAQLQLLDITMNGDEATYTYHACQRWYSRRVQKFVIEVPHDVCDQIMDITADGADPQMECRHDNATGMYGIRFRHADLPNCDSICGSEDDPGDPDNGNGNGNGNGNNDDDDGENDDGEDEGDEDEDDDDDDHHASMLWASPSWESQDVGSESELTDEDLVWLDSVTDGSAQDPEDWRPRKGDAVASSHTGIITITVMQAGETTCGKAGMKMGRHAAYGCIPIPKMSVSDCEFDDDCNDQNACTSDICDAGRCTNEPIDADCDDDNHCTTRDRCSNGTCTGDLLDCNDDNPCTTDSCDPQQGCLNIDNNDDCDDGDACTTGDSCVLGQCEPGNAISCDDANPCTADSCDPNSGCINEDTDSDCDDNNACTINDT